MKSQFEKGAPGWWGRGGGRGGANAKDDFVRVTHYLLQLPRNYLISLCHIRVSTWIMNKKKKKKTHRFKSQHATGIAGKKTFEKAQLSPPRVQSYPLLPLCSPSPSLSPLNSHRN